MLLETHIAPSHTCTHTNRPGDEGVKLPLHHHKGVRFLLSSHGEGVNARTGCVFKGLIQLLLNQLFVFNLLSQEHLNVV